MKRANLMLLFLVLVFAMTTISGCAVSSVMRQGVQQSSEEFGKWVELFKTRLDKMPDQDIGPFTVWVIAVIGDDKERLPREGERLIDKISAISTTQPDDHIYTKKERAELMGAWDRLFIILYEEAGSKGISILKKLVPAIGVL